MLTIMIIVCMCVVVICYYKEIGMNIHIVAHVIPRRFRPTEHEETSSAPNIPPKTIPTKIC